ncbi:ATP-binding cassette domain-containing protein [Alicyclobacillus cycloheptanicus]|uniref:Energy-coupling factor transport system ATP-binding protein n=1 Tax=Alicyclobacillus cycloheptanicus TaxID=1457 RepID=A0ABT9XKE4_9BACL|nr:ATP-binding cassette domain-containing protein [Alicyclobacillus cycloheptanicus]MDQ0190769.1 energy-coupling factor transport system ATP-binding protein [Alicyclobacillus cycloheptanicus]WDM02741.1 ATP-binding cassette domain-containing protein [Alicyclobacillus cycloheptanicus]
MQATTQPYTRDRVVELDGVTVAFHVQDGIRTVLRDIQLTVDAGEWLAVVGKNGSGKTTLARVLARVSPVSKGRVSIDRPVQMVFQNPDAQIVGETVFEDLCFGMENFDVPQTEMPRRAAQAAALAGLHVPLDTPVEQLSGGQKQRLCIASAIAVASDILVWDEPTSMIDPSGRRQILDTARDLRQQGFTIVWVTQRMEELAYADRVVALSEGRIAFVGSPGEFFYGPAADPTAPTGPANAHTASEENAAGPSPCEALGFDAPYVVQVARRLAEAGVVDFRQPILLPEDLVRAVMDREVVDGCR